MIDVIEQWLRNKINHKEIGDYLSELEIKSVAIYGAGKLGELLYDDLLQSNNIEVKYFIDKNASSLYYGIDDMDIYGLEESGNVQNVDAIIVTPYIQFNEIKVDLGKRLPFEPAYIAIDDIVWRVE